MSSHPQKTAAWAANHAVSLDNPDAIGELTAVSQHYGFSSGFITNDPNSQEHVYIPVDVKAIAFEAVARLCDGDREVAKAIMKDARPAIALSIIQTLQAGGYDYDQFDRMDFSPTFREGGREAVLARQVEHPTYSVLICFRGTQAKECAELMVRQIEGGKSLMRTNEIFSPYYIGQLQGAKVTSVRVHDCQDHPLKP